MRSGWIRSSLRRRRWRWRSGRKWRIAAAFPDQATRMANCDFLWEFSVGDVAFLTRFSLILQTGDFFFVRILSRRCRALLLGFSFFFDVAKLWICCEKFWVGDCSSPLSLPSLVFVSLHCTCLIRLDACGGFNQSLRHGEVSVWVWHVGVWQKCNSCENFDM